MDKMGWRGNVLGSLLGNGSLAPLAKRTSPGVNVATTGAPSPVNEIAPTQATLSVARVKGSGVNLILRSGSAALKIGASNFRKCVSGVASSPGGGLIAARSRRYSGTRIKTFRKKLVRVAAPRRSPVLAA